MKNNTKKNPLIIGHRGAASLAEENSILAFDAAISCGIEWVETDIQFTTDNVSVISHNSYYKGQRISSTKYRDLIKESGEKILTLKELLETYGRKLNYNLEIKNPVAFPDVYELVKQYQLCEKVVISSFNHKALLEFTEKFDCLNYAPIIASRPCNIKQFLEPFSSHGIKLIVADADFCDKEMTEEVCNLGFELWLYNINSKEQANEFSKYGVSGIIVDNPKLF